MYFALYLSHFDLITYCIFFVLLVFFQTVLADPSSNHASTSNLQLGPEEETIVVLNFETIQDPPPQQGVLSIALLLSFIFL